MTSPNRYSPHQPEGYHHIGGRLSIHPIERYDDTITCCLPPPSPAPTSDRFVMGIPAPSLSSISSNGSSNGSGINQQQQQSHHHHHHHHQYSDSQQSQIINCNNNSNSSNSSTNSSGSGNNGNNNNSNNGVNSNNNSNINKYGTSQIHRTMSPSSRFRMSDRYRDLSPKCDRFVTTTHFLTNSTPLVSTDAYAYLSSTVHTPVKRYVPTPPPSTELYSDIQQSSSSTSSNSGYHTIGGSNSSHLTHQHQQQQQQQQQQQSTQQQHVSTLPYRFRMKCCLTDQQSSYGNNITQNNLSSGQQSQQNTLHRDRITVTDHYATPPRIRPLKCSSNTVSTSTLTSSHHQNSNNIIGQTTTTTTTAAATATNLPQSVSSSSSSNGSNGNNSTQNIIRQSRATSSMTSQCTMNEYITRTPSIEYLGTAGGRVVTPVSVMSEPVNSTCLHCNTIKRTTGVHQTTQTTGPISPIPQQILTTSQNLTSTNHQESNLDECHSVSPTLSIKQVQISPISSQIPSQQTVSTHIHQTDQLLCNPSPIQHQQQQSSTSHQPINQNNSILSSHGTLTGGRNIPNTQQQQQQQHHHHHHQNNHVQSQLPPIVSVPTQQQQQNHRQQNHHLIASNNSSNTGSNNNLLSSTPQRNTLTLRQQMQQRFTRKQRLKEYVRKEIAQFFGVDTQIEDEEKQKWCERQKRLAIRRFGPLKSDNELNLNGNGRHTMSQQLPGDRPDILPAQTTAEESQINHLNNNLNIRLPIQKKLSVPTMIMAGIFYIIQTLNKRQLRNQKQWSRSFAPSNVTALNGDNPGDICEGLTALQEDEVFFDTNGNDIGNNNNNNGINRTKIIEHSRQIYMGERVHGWRTSATIDQQPGGIVNGTGGGGGAIVGNGNQVILGGGGNNGGGIGGSIQQRLGYRGIRISSQLLDGVLENSRRPIARKVKMFHSNELDDRNDHRPFFTYWINTVQILVLILSLICYGIGPIGFGIEQKTGQVLVTSLSLQTVQHQEQRNVWIGPRNNDLVHLGAKFAACMRRDVKIMDVISKTRRQERETACCIRNDDSGCVQSSQADCSVRGLWPTKSISTWKKWSPGESGPGGRISGSVCGLDPKYCDAPASIAPYEWPDDITKWPICRKTNSFSQRFRFKDHTAEHMVCEVIGHPCCTGVFGECRITTREYCDFVNGYFHEEASLCSQVSCLNNVCGMFPFLVIEVPDQFYRLFTSLCLHAGILHLAITVAFQHIFLADLERLIGPIRTAIVYIGSGLAGNLTSAILVPYKPEVGPLASLAGVISSLVVLLLLIHWRKLKKPHLALLKLILIGGTLFGMGTLPWQQNFAGLIAGIFCGVFLTIALVPFVSITKYGRKAKINLIWTCILFHLFIYTIMFVIFYIFPTELTSINIGDMLNGNSININNNNQKNRFDIDNFGSNNNIPLNNNNNNNNNNHHHHHTDVIDQGGEDRVMSGGTVNEMTSISNLNIIKYINNNKIYGNQQHQQQHQQQQQQYHYHIVGSNNNINNNDIIESLDNNYNNIINLNIKSCLNNICSPTPKPQQQQNQQNEQEIINRNNLYSISSSSSSSSISNTINNKLDINKIYKINDNLYEHQNNIIKYNRLNNIIIGADDIDISRNTINNNNNNNIREELQLSSNDQDGDINGNNESLNINDNNNYKKIINKKLININNSNINRIINIPLNNNNNNDKLNQINGINTNQKIKKFNNNIKNTKINLNSRLSISDAINRHIITA